MADRVVAARDELLGLMQAANRWTVKVVRLQGQAGALEQPQADGEAVERYETLAQLAQLRAERDEALARAAEWERKAQTISRVMAAERIAKGRDLMALRQEIEKLRFQSEP